MELDGIHHITAITGDAPANVDFYAGVLGLRLVKKTVNQDDPTVYHLFYADADGSPGSDLTFFEYPGAPLGRAGEGMVHRICWRVASTAALDFWEQRLAAAGVESERAGRDRPGSDDEVGPDGRDAGAASGATGADADAARARATGARAAPKNDAREGLRFRDPEGLAHELLIADVPDEPLRGDAPDVPVEMALQGFDAVRVYSSHPEGSERVLAEVLGCTRAGEASWKVRGPHRGGRYVYDLPPDERPIAGAGTVHHVAFASDPAEQEAWQQRIAAGGLRPTPVIDRFYFRSVYFREPSGVLMEIATIGPGFAVDEDAEHLGEHLSLPPRFEPLRERLEQVLTPLPDPRAARS